ncbi:MAG: hypothetical protein NVSMB62_22560 [Acidobacteriaceae bacterium]
MGGGLRLNGCAMFAHKHALAPAYASGDGKCKGRGISHHWNGGEAGEEETA